MPVAAGVFRVAELATGEADETNQRFFDLPVPVLVHVFGAVIYCVLGAFQFMPSFRRRRPALAPLDRPRPGAGGARRRAEWPVDVGCSTTFRLTTTPP